MESRGFRLAKRRLQYTRQLGDIYHFVSAQISRGGDAIRIWVFPWAPEGQAPYDMSRFPDGVAVFAGGALDDQRLGIGGKHWKIETEAQAAGSFRDVVRLLDRVGLPFLDSIATREALAAAVLPSERLAAGGVPRADLILGKCSPYSGP